MSTPTSPEHASLVGTVVADRYEVRALLGEGGMARVYAAHDRKHDRPVAIKMLRGELTLALGVDRFLREIRISARLTHPNILPLYDSGEHTGALFYVMPLVEGESLRERLARSGPIPLDEAVRLAREIGEALTYAHEQGFVHRDIKPDNIMLARGHALVADFGIARALSGVPDVSLTSTGLSLGTPLYMSPEQALSDPGLNYQTDIYSLGCVVYEMLTGHPPFIATNATALLARHISEPPPDLPAMFPPNVADVVRQAMAKQPEDRFATALGFAEALVPGVHASSTSFPAIRQDTLPVKAGSRFLRAGRRYHLALVLAALVIVFAIASFRAVRFVIAYRESGLSAAPGLDPANGWMGNWDEPVTMLGLGDTAVAVQLGPALLIFNGREWNRVVLPYEQTQLAVIAGDVWGFNAAGPGREQRLTAAKWVSGDSIPIAALAVWSKGSDIVIANARGEFAERTGARWQQLPSGRRTIILKLFGASRDSLTGVGVFAMGEDSDSLIRRDGAIWQSFDPQGRRDNEWIYHDGATLAGGTSVVVGYERKASNQRVPLLLNRPSGTNEWTRVEGATNDIPQRQLDQIVPLAGEEAIVWSFADPGLLILRNQRSSPVEVLRDRHVRAVAVVGEVPVVLTDVGSLMMRRGTSFEFYGELPLRPGAGTGNLTHGELAALTGLLGSPRLPVLRAVRSGPRKWMLTEDSAVYSAQCRGSECSVQLEWGGESDVTDLAASGPRVVVVGRQGFVREWQDGHWISPRWALRVTGELQLVSIAQDGATMIARRDSIFLIGPGSVEVHAVSTEGRGTPEAIAASRDSGGAALWNHSMMKLAWDGTVVRTLRRFGPQFTSARFTCDGRLMTTSAAPGDPLMGGDATAGWAGSYANLSFNQLPVPLDLSDVVINSVGTIRLVGRGGVWLSTRSLEYAAANCVDTTGMRRRGLHMEPVVGDW